MFKFIFSGFCRPHDRYRDLQQKKVNNINDFFLGGRKMGPWISAFAYGTTYFSAVIFIGYAGRIGWGFGISSTWIGIGNAVLGSLLAWIVLAKANPQNDT